jgi:AcrR family transcriptional regulator
MPSEATNSSPNASGRVDRVDLTRPVASIGLNASTRVAKAIKDMQDKVEAINEAKAGSVLSWQGTSFAQKQDRRSRRTRARLINALLELLGHKSINSITVTELTEMADVNRATFYSHYRDVHDMLDQLKADWSKTIYEVVSKHSRCIGKGDYAPLIKEIVDYLDKNESLISAVMGPNGDGTFFNDIIEVLRQACYEAMISENNELRELFATHPNECNYHFYFISGGVVSILKSWIENGSQESPEQITQTINNYVSSIPISLLTNSIKESDARKDENESSTSEKGAGDSASRIRESTGAEAASLSRGMDSSGTGSAAPGGRE